MRWIRVKYCLNQCLREEASKMQFCYFLYHHCSFKFQEATPHVVLTGAMHLGFAHSVIQR